jgi:thiamine pyrophosphokinase
MKTKNRYIIFLSHRYKSDEIEYYRKFLRGRILVAVDGGIRFFLRNKIKPDVLIGDFDSMPRLSKKYLSGIEVITHPAKKDKTDGHLAIDMVLNRAAKDILICGAISSREIDHVLGNVFLLKLINDSDYKKWGGVKAKIISPEVDLFFLENDTVTINGQRGDIISLVPLSIIKKLRFSGLVYPAPDRIVKPGDSLTLRNEIKSKRASISVEGCVLICHTFK